jgi:hypothetical protein
MQGNNMKIAPKTVTLLLLLTTTIFALNSKELAVTLDLSSKQQILTQKMTKEAFLIKFNINKQSNIEKLKYSSQLFDKILKGLLEGDRELKLTPIKDADIKKEIQKSLSIWKIQYKEIQNITNETITQNSYNDICNRSDKLLKEMNQLLKLYTLYDTKNNFILANDMKLAGKQKMLLQKMAKSILVINNGIEVEKYKDEFLTSQKLFTKTLKGLLEGDGSLKLRGVEIPQINEQLKVVEELWSKEQKSLENALLGKDTQKAISALDNITTEMNKSVKLYITSLNKKQQRDEFESLIEVHTSLEKMDMKTRELIEKLAQAEVE